MTNEYIPFLSKIKEIVKHTETEYTFRMTYVGEVRPGQFFEVSIPKYGEAPISVSGIGEDYVDLTIRKVGKVTGEIFELNEGSSFFMRGPYGNGFKKENYQGKELIVVAGGTGVSPVRGVISYFGEHPDEVKKLHTILGFKSPEDILFRDDLRRWEQQMNLVLTVDSSVTSTTPRVVRRRVGMTGRLMKDSVMKGSMSVPTPRAWAAFLASSRRVLTSRRGLPLMMPAISRGSSAST